jgi:hypothetical protein
VSLAKAAINSDRVIAEKVTGALLPCQERNASHRPAQSKYAFFTTEVFRSPSLPWHRAADDRSRAHATSVRIHEQPTSRPTLRDAAECLGARHPKASDGAFPKLYACPQPPSHGLRRYPCCRQGILGLASHSPIAQPDPPRAAGRPSWAGALAHRAVDPPSQLCGARWDASKHEVSPRIPHIHSTRPRLVNSLSRARSRGSGARSGADHHPTSRIRISAKKRREVIEGEAAR